MTPSARTIVIVWSWTSSVTGEGEWGVDKGDTLHNCTVLCKDLRATDNALPQLVQLLEDYTANDGDVMFFLHRHHGYEPQHVRTLLEYPLPNGHGTCQCFLFGEGADPIYLTNNPRGLLGIAGTFSALLSKGGGVAIPLSAVADADGRLLKAAHFDYIWQLYERAIARSIFELKEDFLAFLSGYLPQTTFHAGALYPLLNAPTQRLLLLRLLSFVGRVRKASALSIELRSFERQHNRPFSFDDCGLQLAAVYGRDAAEKHALLAAFILKNILAQGDPVTMLDIREKFDALLEQFPEKSYHT